MALFADDVNPVFLKRGVGCAMGRVQVRSSRTESHCDISAKDRAESIRDHGAGHTALSS